MTPSSLAGLLLGAAAGSVFAACPPAADDGRTVGDGAVQLAWRTDPTRLTVGQPFVLLLGLCPLNATLQRVDATMPEHRHGMNYRPSLQPLGDGRWRVEGLLWHMAGRWEWQFDVLDPDGKLHRLRQAVPLQ